MAFNYTQDLHFFYQYIKDSNKKPSFLVVQERGYISFGACLFCYAKIYLPL